MSVKKPLIGSLKVPGDKSISHRALIFGAIAHGKTSVSHALRSADVMSTLHCLKNLGALIEESQGQFLITGQGLEGLKAQIGRAHV